MSNYFNNTRLKTFRENPRVYYWKYESKILGGFGLDLDTIDKNLFFGELAHEGLAAMYEGLNWRLRIKEFATERLCNITSLDTLQYWEDQLIYLEALLSRYDEWRKEHDNFEPIEIETAGSSPISATCVTCGTARFDGDVCEGCSSKIYHHVFRADLVVNTPQGLRVIDHKTRGGSADARFQKSWRYSSQMWGYCASHSRSSGQTVKGYTVNIIRKLSLTVKRKTPLDFFIRVDEDFSEDKALRWDRMTLDTIRRIEYERELFEQEPRLAWPMNPEDYFRWGESMFLDLDYSAPRAQWWDPHPDLLEKFIARTEDYVDTKTLIREDLK